jgi:hypothetical protein
MAIVDNRRVPNWHFYKEKRKRTWYAYNAEHLMLYGLVVAYEGDEPMEERFHYCSGQSQPVFVDGSHYPGFPDPDRYTPSSWKKMPEGWRAIFRRDLFGEEV